MRKPRRDLNRISANRNRPQPGYPAWKIGVPALIVCLTLWVGVLVARAAESTLFRIGTGGRAGVYYPLGKLIAQAITETAGTGDRGIPGHIGVAQSSGGSVANLRALASGEIEAGLVQADVASWAYHANHLFKGDPSLQDVRAVASLYPEKLQIVCRSDAGIRQLSDVKGKRVSIDETGSGTLAAMRIVLESFGISEADFTAVYLKPEFTIEKIRNAELHAFAVVAGVPMAAVDQIADIGLSIVPIPPGEAERIHSRYPYLFPGEIPADVYPGVPATPTLQVHALLVVSTGLPSEIVHRLTAILWEDDTQTMLRNGHPQAAAITIETALDGVSIPLHPGAEAYYRSRGMIMRN